MALTRGTRLGPYEIVSSIGAGGMGEVYRARDTKLGRDVALKVLPEAFAADAERISRFEREAKVLASLNHPNIASIYGFEDSSGAHALAMELVEGQTLAARIANGPLTTDEALSVAKQICEGLEYAHERGMVHRDLKPANVKITPEGTVKLLDFGLAKALEGEAAAGDISTSPTISRLATQAGIVLGTAAYMSPEQAKGKAVDRRADIWAFGCVFYEMLTGRQAFGGETVTDVLAAVVMKEPDWTALPQSTPQRIRELLRRCLTKDAKQRLQAIGEARVAISEVPSSITVDLKSSIAVAAPQVRASAWRRAVPWAGVMVFGVVAILLAYGYLRRTPQTARAIVSEIPAPANATFAFGGNVAGPPVISPDGERIAFAAISPDAKRRLWVRLLDSTAAQPLEGTEGATFPFWSPDGRSLGFFANGKLNRIDASGGPELAVADASNGRGGSWGADGTILFTPDTISPIYRVPAAGGTPQAVTKLNAARQDFTHRWPQFLPDGKHFLFYAHGNFSQNDGTYVASLDGGEPKLLVAGDSNALYAQPGYLLFVRQGTLMAQRWDAGSLRLIGEATPLAEHAGANLLLWHAVLGVSENGLLAYQAGNPVGENGHLLWFDRDGRQIGETGTSGYFTAASLSPDGSKLAAEIGIPGVSGFNIWVFDLARGTATRLTFSSSIDAAPCWSPDGKTIAFESNRSGHTHLHLYEKAADGTRNTSSLLVDNADENNPSFSPDGRYLMFERVAATPGSHSEIWALPLFGDRKAFPVAKNPQFDLAGPALSPDGKWLAYSSHESGLPELYVVPFGKGTGKWEVSNGGGTRPRWRHDGGELFYLSLDDKMMSAEISPQAASLVIGKVVPLFQTNPAFSSHVHWPYDVSADGKKFVVATESLQKLTEPLTLIVNWPALLKRQ
ncbi:MAG: protein kinase [Acidobacteriota bacterium]|nr:protein kinase [Acidobacteriota bacterium]